MPLPEKIQRLDEQIATAVRRAVQEMGEEMGRRLRESREEIEQRLSRLASSLPESFLGEEEVEPLTTAAAADARRQALSEVRDAIAAIDRATSQAEVLNALLGEAGRFASRSALFLTRPDGIVGWGSFGFADTDQAVSDLVLDYSESGTWSRDSAGRGSLLLSAAECAHLCSRLESPLPRDGVLIPLVLRDQVAATLYADRRETDAEIALDALETLTYVAAQALETLALRNRRATPTLRLAAEAADEPALPIWRPETEPEAPIGQVGQVGPVGGAGEGRAVGETGEPGGEEAGSAADGDQVLAAEPPEPPIELESEPAEVSAETGAEDELAAGTGIEVEEAPTTVEEAGGWQLKHEDESAAEVGWTAQPEPEPEPAAEATPAAALPDGALLEGPSTEQSWASAFDEDDTLNRPAPIGRGGFEEPAPVSLIEEPASVFAEEEPLTPASAPATLEEVPPPFGLGDEPRATTTLAPEEEAGPEEALPPVSLDDEAEAPPAPAEEDVLWTPAEPAPVPPAAEPLVAGTGVPAATMRLQTHDVSTDETVLLRRESLLEPPAPPAPAAPQPPTATRPIPAHAESAQVTPPSDVDGPGWAFATTRLPVSSDEETIHEEARRLARLLVSEIKLYNEEQVEDGRRNRDIYDRLKEDIDRSRQMYEERIDDRIRNSTDYFYQELVRILAAGDPKALGI